MGIGYMGIDAFRCIQSCTVAYRKIYHQTREFMADFIPYLVPYIVYLICSTIKDSLFCKKTSLTSLSPFTFSLHFLLNAGDS